MKFGILTYANTANFGANLQALSTVSYLQNHGHEAFVIDWCPDDMAKAFQSSKSVQAQEHYNFFNNEIPHTRKVRNDKEIAQLLDDEHFDAVIVGSDAVLQHSTLLSRFWFPTSTIFRLDHTTTERHFPNAFWGSFYPLLRHYVPMVIMSGSCQGTRYYTILLRDRINITRTLKHFSYISVRDTWTQKMIKSVTFGTINPPITPDPVFAFNQNVPQNISREEIINKYKLPKKYVLVSFKGKNHISVNWLKQIKVLFHDIGYECVAFPMPEGIMFPHPFNYEIQPPLPPLDWYNLIRFSNGYIGENMHPIVVSLHNANPFFSFDPYVIKLLRFIPLVKASKTLDILKTFGLQDNWTNLKKYVSPEYVFNKIIHFDKLSCQKVSEKMLSNYNDMMDTIIHICSNKMKG